MLKQRAKLVATAHVVLDAAVVAASFAVAHALRSQIFPLGRNLGLKKVGPLEGYVAPMVAAMLIDLALFLAFRLYGSFRTQPFRSEAWKITKALGLGALVLFALNFATKTDPARSLLALFVVVSYVLLVAERLSIRVISGWVRERGYNYRTVVIVGTGPKARDFAGILHDHRHWGLKLLGFVAEDGAATAATLEGYDVLGTVADMPALIDKHVIDEVVMVVPKNRLEELEDTFLLCEEAGIKTRVAVSMFPHLIAKVDLEDIDGVPLLTFSTTPTNEVSLVVKRALDVTIALFLLLLTAPVMLATALLIKLDSRGPVLFRQIRIGLQGRKFVLYKFRSMVEDAASRLPELQHLNEMDGPVFKMKDDPRVTRVGRLIRRYSIDELPQLLNVLKGDMCIVGPRPPMSEEVQSYERWQKRRLSMKPGLTCLWQVNGRNAVSFGEWMKLDLQYIDNWSLLLDFKILLRTIPMVLSGRGAS